MRIVLIVVLFTSIGMLELRAEAEADVGENALEKVQRMRSEITSVDYPRPVRTPKWPLKTERTLLTAEQIERAREACASEPEAAKIRDRILKAAKYWVEKSDDYLRELLPGGEVPRAFNVSAHGCPIHGDAIYKYGTYPWKLDRDKPFAITCPVGGEEYPSNDFVEYYRTGMKDEGLLTGDYADDGWGWKAPNGEKYWMVGYACQWAWIKFWVPAVKHLAQAYILTGERQYAHKCLVMLDRIAECYPGFEYAEQSRYSEMTGGNYHGKLVNKIWETGQFRSLVQSYDAVFDALLGPEAIAFDHRNSEEIRANIEANLIEEGIDCIDTGRIAGNWGMHQSALAKWVGKTPRSILQSYARKGGVDFTGTADHVAGMMQEIMEEVGGDGFLIFNSYFDRRYVMEVCDGLVPELQRRGVTRKA